MSKFRPITRYELLQRIVRAIPEINPQYVEEALPELQFEFYDVSEVGGWIQLFEDAMKERS